MEKAKERLTEIGYRLRDFLLNPVKGIESLPNWDWLTLFGLQLMVSWISSILAGLVSLNILVIFLGLVLMPLAYLIVTLVSSVVLYYMVLVFLDREMEPRQLFTVVVFAHIPFYIAQIVSPIFPLITLAGMGFSGFLLGKGLIWQFQLPQKFVIKSLGAIYGLIFLMWFLGQINAQF